MSRVFNCVDRELVELAIDLLCGGETVEYALSHAAQRLRDAGRKGIRFDHVLRLEGRVTPEPKPGVDARIASLQALLAAMSGGGS
jgi:hypothetical protein